MKKLFLIVILFFSLGCSLATACSGPCTNYGEITVQGMISCYCDYDSESWVAQKGITGDCLNDFECVEGYSCLSGECTGSFNSLLEEYSQANTLLSGVCADSGLFCSNVSGLLNANLLTTKNCSYKGSGFSCYKCNGTATYNATLDACITGMCSSTPGCLNVSVNNSTVNSNYCPSSQQCYQCDSDFTWNANRSSCIMKSCEITSNRIAGCLNQTNLTNAYILDNRLCSVGSCFSCGSSYVWNSTTSICVLSSSSSNIIWSTAIFTTSELVGGAYKILSVNDKVSFSFAGRSYYFGLSGADAKISFLINPVISNQNLYAGETRGFDLDNDGTYDIRVSLASVGSGKANVSLRLVSEQYSLTNNPSDNTIPMPDRSVDTQTNPGDETNLDSSAVNQSFLEKNIWTIVIIGVIFIGLLIFLIVYFLKRNEPATSPNASGANVGNPSFPVQPRPPMPPNVYPRAPIGGYRPLPTQQPIVQRRM